MKRFLRKITSEEFDRKFDEGEDMADYLDKSKALTSKEIHRVNIDFPQILLRQIDKEAHKIGVARTALIKVWIAERLGYA